MSYNLKKTFEWYYNLEDKNDFFSPKNNIQKWLTEEGHFYRNYYGKEFGNPDYTLKVMYDRFRKIIPKLKFLSQIGVLDPENTGFQLRSSTYFYIDDDHFEGFSSGPSPYLNSDYRFRRALRGPYFGSPNYFNISGAYDAILLFDHKFFSAHSDSLYREGRYSTLHILKNNNGIFLTSVNPKKALLLPNWSWKEMKHILKSEKEARNQLKRVIYPHRSGKKPELLRLRLKVNPEGLQTKPEDLFDELLYKHISATKKPTRDYSWTIYGKAMKFLSKTNQECRI